jgi:hypothetical protein
VSSAPATVLTEHSSVLEILRAVKAKQDALDKKQREFKLEQQANAWTKETGETRKEGLQR